MRKTLFSALFLFFLSVSASAQNSDEIIAKYIKAIGGMDKIKAVKTMKTTGKFVGGGGFEAKIVEEKKRGNVIRQEFILQGMVQIVAFDSKSGWKIDPFSGKKDVETLDETELKGMVEASDFDGPLIDYKEKGNKIEYLGIDQVDGDDAYKLKVTLKSGDIRTYYFDTDYFVPIKIESKTFVRGQEFESETSLGDYKQVAGVYYPFSSEIGQKGSQFKSQVITEKIEVNVALEDTRFTRPK
jgi:outer membrane lipoprotein-sorting protein